MTRDDIIRMAREAGFEVHERKQQARVGIDALIGVDSTAKLERFAAMVAAAEREACAKVFDDVSRNFDEGGWPAAMGKFFKSKAAAIRARGQS